MNFQGGFALAILAGLGVALTLTFQHPPVVTTQIGYRGLSMGEINTERDARLLRASVQIPPNQDPAPAGGPLATTEYKNVQVLTDLTVDQFNRVMLSITEWVSPEQGCAYCHAEGEELSSDKLFTKVVSRRMLQMTRTINAAWKAHVADTGVRTGHHNDGVAFAEVARLVGEVAAADAIVTLDAGTFGAPF